MNKGLKVLSGVLALTIGLATASLVGALPEKLSPAAMELLKVKVDSVSVPTFYDAITTKPEYAALLKKADREFVGLTQDADEWARLQTLYCVAKQKIESIDNQLAAFDHFVAMAANYKAGVSADYNTLGEAKTEGTGKKAVTTPGEYKAVKFPGGKIKSVNLMSDEKAEFDRLVAENKKLSKEYDKLKDKVEAYKTKGDGPVSEYLFATSLYERFKANQEGFEALAEHVTSDPYRESAAYVSNYTEDKANATLFKSLQADKIKLNGILSFVEKIAHDNGLQLARCGLPESDRAAAEEGKNETAKKDSVPNTAAAGGSEYVRIYFKNLMPTKVLKVVLVKNDIDYAKIPRINVIPTPAVEVVEVEVPAPAFTFNYLLTR